MPGFKAMKGNASGRDEHWSALTDDDLLNRNLTTDNPETLEGLVTQIPDRHKEAHVEFKYDFRGQDRAELHCVHGHHAHKAGFVMNVGGQRFLVGWICGKTIYGEDFERYTKAYDQAVERQNALRRAKQIRDAIDPFTYWLAKIPHAEVFPLYNAVRLQWIGLIPWLYDQLRIKCLKHGGHLSVRENVQDMEAEQQDDTRYQRECQIHAKGGPKPQPSRKPIFKEGQKLLCHLPAKTFFENTNNLREEAIKVSNALFSQIPALERALKQGNDIESLIQMIRERLTKLDTIISEAREVEDLFQPGILAAIAEWANHSDNSKRSYKAGLTEITMTSSKGEFIVSIPKNYRTPNRSPIAEFRNARAGLYTV
jgi:hypothetical protein